MGRRSLASLLLIAGTLSLPQSAFANTDFERDGDEQIEQIIPPAMVDDPGLQKSDPIDFDNVVITDRTPADHFVSATTPLVVALMLGSVGLVIYTLARGDKFD